MSTADGSAGRKRQFTLVGWTVALLLWFWIVVTDSTGTLAAGTLPEVALGLALVAAVVVGVVAVGTASRVRSLSQLFLVVGGVAVILSVVHPAWIPVGAERLSLVGGLAVVCGGLLHLSTTVDAAENSPSA